MTFSRRLTDWYTRAGGLEAILFWAILALIPLLMVGFLLLGEDTSRDAPYGCTWIDMDPSKTSDYQLACVEGYWEKSR